MSSYTVAASGTSILAIATVVFSKYYRLASKAAS